LLRRCCISVSLSPDSPFALEHRDHPVEGETRAPVAHCVSSEVLGLGHPHLRAGALDEPGGKPAGRVM